MVKKYFIIIDTETTQDNKVADFGAVIIDKQGNVVNSLACLVKGIYDNREKHPLFHLFGDSNDIFSKESLPRRYAEYDAMLASGDRILMKPSEISQWLQNMNSAYSPVLTAYNLAFDLDKCHKTRINLSDFAERFCLWQAALRVFSETKAYKRFCLQNHYFGNKTKTGAMGMQTKAETMAHFVTGNNLKEPHTAIEDARDFEAPILQAILKKAKVSDYMTPYPYNWRKYQLRDMWQL